MAAAPAEATRPADKARLQMLTPSVTVYSQGDGLFLTVDGGRPDLADEPLTAPLRTSELDEPTDAQRPVIEPGCVVSRRPADNYAAFRGNQP